MFFSIVVPLYNKGYSVCRCIDSILSQSFERYELIIVNDGSTDKSLSIVESNYKDEIDSGVITIVSQLNKGVSAARNLGVKLSKSNYICFLDADDEWLPGFLKTMSLLVERCPEANLYCLAHMVSKEGGVHYRPKHGLPNNYRGYVDEFFKASSKGSVANSSKVCVKKQAIMKFGGFPEGVVAGEDLFVWIMLALQGKVACSMDYMAVVHQQVDASRSLRKVSTPYPFIYFSKNTNILKTKSLNKYLFTIFYKHFLHSLISLNPKEATIRLKWYISMYI